MKKYRDKNGKLTASISDIKRDTAAEAARYFTVGAIYLLNYEKREYVLIEKDSELAHFRSYDDRHLFIPLDSLGTFLPDVASEGNELILQ